METFPLESLSVEEAMKQQFKLVDIITKHFTGEEFLSAGDLGVVKGLNKPRYTQKTEKILAEFFGSEKALLVRGAGTGALRYSFISFLKPGDELLVHDAPLYPTTKVSLQSMGIHPVYVNFNDEKAMARVLRENPNIKGALIQRARQKINDCYNFGEVINLLKSLNPALTIVTDENYTAMKTKHVGIQYGADLVTFSLFKLLGPEGIGLILGSADLLTKIEKFNYSGGSQVQGHEAMEALRGLVYAPVMLAIQAEVNEEIVQQLNAGKVTGVAKAYLANAQSKVVLVELTEPIADRVLYYANKLGAAPHPIGAESKYEIVPMFYRVSSTFLQANPELGKKMIRINPMRSGANTVLRILSTAIEKAFTEQKLSGENRSWGKE